MKKLLFFVSAAVAVGFSYRLNAEVRTASTSDELSAAISAAANGDEIRLAAGTWTIAAQISTSKALTLSGGWNADFETRADEAVTTLDGADASNLLSLSPGSGECVVERIGFTRSLSSALVKSGNGTLLVKDCSFLANAAASTAQGRALNLSGAGAVTVRGCRFEGNVATLDSKNERQGGAVYANAVGHLTVEDSDFIANGLSLSVVTTGGPANEGLGGAALCIHGTPCEIRRCEFRGNVSRAHDRAECGGTVLLYNNCDGSVIEDCLFAGNQCLRSNWGQSTSGAVYVNQDNAGRSVTICGCTFAYNLGIPASYPSGLYVSVGKVQVVDSVFYGNIVQNTSVVAKDLATGVNGTIDISHSMLPVNGPASFSGTVSRGEGMLYGDPLFATDADTVASYVSASSKTFDAAHLADICAMDLHVKSASGRWTAAGWVKDEVNSLTLDWATDDAAWENEPEPNGNRRNIGYYGNSSEASKSEPAAPQLADVTISYPTPYTKPTVTVTAGATGGTYYNATLTVTFSDGQSVYTAVATLVGIGDVKALVAPEYFDPGQTITIKVELAVRGKTTATREFQHTVDPTKIRPPWIGHGGDPEKIIHVRGGADSAQDGTSWTDAFGDIASALAAVTATKNEIWVCGTVECPDTLMPLTPPADVVIRGGFSAEEDALEDRDPDASKRATIDFKDQGGPLKLAIPSGRKVSIERLNIVHGAENGIYKTDAGELYVADSTIECNGLYAAYAQGRGVNLSGSGSTATFTNCLFAGNAVCQPIGHNGTLNGGAIYASGLGCLRLIDSLFLTNGVAVTSARPGPAPYGYGGAAVYATGTKVVASGCEFRGNVATSHNGGTTAAVRLVSGCNGSSFTNCLFVGNSNLLGNYNNASSGALNVALGNPSYSVDVVNCTIAYNLDSVPAGAAGIYVDNATVNLVNSIVYGNRPRTGTTGASDLLTSETGSIRSSYSMITADTLAVHRGNFTDVIGTFFGDPLFVTSAEDFNACVLVENDNLRFRTATAADIAEVCDFDVHPKAKLGYWLNDGTYVDSGDVNSPALDKGDPTADYSREVEPNGGRVNTGCYGNTPEASHSRLDKPEIDSVEITYPDGYPQPNVAVTMGGAAGSEYSETVYILYGTGDVAQCGYAFTNVFSNVKCGDVVRGVAPHYFGLGEEIAVSVVVSPLSREPIIRGIPETVPDNLVYPAWYGKGGGSNVVHVRAGANCLKTGDNWTDAFPDITSAIAALKGGKTEVWVAGHVFASRAPQTLSPEGPVAILGGFAGCEESASEREPGLRSTVDGNATFDLLVINNASERPVRLERLVLTRGEARGLQKSGAGELVMDDCVVLANGRNSLGGGGRGISLSGGQQVTITNCVFAGNVAETSAGNGGLYGGAISAENLGRLMVSDTLFVTNGIEFARFTQSQPWYYLTGTAIYANNSPVTLSGCAFRANAGRPHDAYGCGGTILLSGSCGGSVISNCLFVGNMDAKPGWGSSAGGTLHLKLSTVDTSVDMVNCTLAFNCTDASGAGGICVEKGCLNLINSIVYGNRQFSSLAGPRDLDVRADGTVNASYCLFTGDAAPYIRCAGTTNFTNVIYADPKFVTTDAEVQSQREVGTQRYRLDNECAAAVCGFNVHVRGRTGYLDEITGQLTPAYSKDECSPAIDAGDPASKAWRNERSPTGHRTNLGAYGGTPYSSGIPCGLMMIIK